MNSFLKYLALLTAIIAIHLVFCSSLSLAFTTTYKYDDTGRLISEDYGNGTIVTYNYDENGNIVSRVCTLTKQPPIIDTFSANSTSGAAPLTVSFTCTAHDPDGTIASYKWDFDGDGTVDTTTATDTTSYTYNTVGTYQAKVTVVDNSGAETTSVPVTITVGLTVPGDCNGDGTVSIDEIQKAINCFLGIQNSCCDRCDLDDSGQVSIDEVQKVINAFLGK